MDNYNAPSDTDKKSPRSSTANVAQGETTSSSPARGNETRAPFPATHDADNEDGDRGSETAAESLQTSAQGRRTSSYPAQTPPSSSRAAVGRAMTNDNELRTPQTSLTSRHDAAHGGGVATSTTGDHLPGGAFTFSVNAPQQRDAQVALSSCSSELFSGGTKKHVVTHSSLSAVTRGGSGEDAMAGQGARYTKKRKTGIYVLRSKKPGRDGSKDSA